MQKLSPQKQHFDNERILKDELFCYCHSDRSHILFSCSSWTSINSLNTGRVKFRVVWFPDGRIFILGGSDAPQNHLTSVQMGNRPWVSNGVTENTWREVAPMFTERMTHVAAYFRDVIIVIGGFAYNGPEWDSWNGISIIEIFTPPPLGDTSAIGEWTAVDALTTTLFAKAFAVLNDELFIFGMFILL